MVINADAKKLYVPLKGSINQVVINYPWYHWQHWDEQYTTGGDSFEEYLASDPNAPPDLLNLLKQEGGMVIIRLHPGRYESMWKIIENFNPYFSANRVKWLYDHITSEKGVQYRDESGGHSIEIIFKK